MFALRRPGNSGKTHIRMCPARFHYSHVAGTPGGMSHSKLLTHIKGMGTSNLITIGFGLDVFRGKLTHQCLKGV